VYVTDTGYLSNKNLEKMYNADFYILESNHDSMMLMETNRPLSLKKRILDDEGHLSNYDCAQALAKLIGPKTKEIVLAHLSEEANDPQLAYETLIEVLTNEKIDYKQLKIGIAMQNESYLGGNYEETVIDSYSHLSKLECVSDH
jgi:phosphoribosyl 1,2-cyclic phosphodiesterase